jgi:hypothetical protein
MSNSGILRAKIPSLPATVMHSEFRSNLKGELTMGIYIYIYIYLFIFILFYFIFLCPILESSSVPKSPSQVPTAMHAEFSSNLNGELITCHLATEDVYSLVRTNHQLGSSYLVASKCLTYLPAYIITSYIPYLFIRVIRIKLGKHSTRTLSFSISYPDLIEFPYFADLTQRGDRG